MEGFMAKKQSLMKTRMSPSSPLAIHRDSHSISKATQKPKIRIIHIFAPEIIKTDAANFRELVQRLTGKPPAEKEAARPNGFPRKPLAKRIDAKDGCAVTELLGLEGFNNVKDQRVIKEEEYHHDDHRQSHGVWSMVNGHDDDGIYHHHGNTMNDSSGGFLDKFADLEGIIGELNSGEFPLLIPSLLNPNLEANNSHHVHYGSFGIGGTQLA